MTAGRLRNYKAFRRMKILHPTRHENWSFKDVLPIQSLCTDKTKPNTTKTDVHQEI